MGLCLELAYPMMTNGSESRDVSSRPGYSTPFRHRLPLNSFIDSILRTVYHASAPPPDGHGVRRQIIFTSSSPDACAAVNWKQPNCQCSPPTPIPLIFFLSSFFLASALQCMNLKIAQSPIMFFFFFSFFCSFFFFFFSGFFFIF